MSLTNMKVWIKREERQIEIFEVEMNRVEPRVYIDLGISIDQGGIKRFREQKIDRLRGIKEESMTKSL